MPHNVVLGVGLRDTGANEVAILDTPSFAMEETECDRKQDRDVALAGGLKRPSV
jgi:hypothetical protein